MNPTKAAFLFFLTLILSPAFGAYGQKEPGKVEDEAHHALLDEYDVKFYFIDLEVSDTSTAIRGATTILAEMLVDASNMLVLDMGNTLHVDSVFLNGQRAEFNHKNEALSVFRPFSSSGKEQINIQVFYHGSADGRDRFGGLYNARDMVWGNRVTWTLSEPFSSMYWFPCKQVLNDKADSVYVFITTDKDLKAGSNGLLTAQTELPDGRIRHEWKSRYPVAYYLISFAVSDYRDYSFHVPLAGRGDSMLVQNYIYNNDVFFSNYRDDIDMTKDFFILFEELFGPYPFQGEKYGHCLVPSGGGMEHQTMTTLENFSFVLVSHELAHQWFGNLVTCRTWQDIWINEGFASYAEYIAYQHLVSQEKADQWMLSAHDMVRSRPGGSVMIPSGSTENVGRIFDYRLSYKKGAAIIHMIRYEINDDSLFFSILRDFLSRYRQQTASAADFRTLLEEKTSMDFTGFFDQWYAGEGYPIVSCLWQQKNDTLYLRANQSTSSSTSLFDLRLEIMVSADGRDSLITRRLASGTATWKIPFAGVVTAVEADPFHWLLGEYSAQYREMEDIAPESTVRSTDHTESVSDNPLPKHMTWYRPADEGNPYNLLPYKTVKD